MKNDLLTISELAYFSRTTRDTLLFYDKIGLIKPTTRTENNYRYYSHDKIATVNLIRTLQMFGMQLDEIRGIIDHREPKLFLEMCKDFSKYLDGRIDEMQREKAVLNTLRKMIEDSIDINEKEINYAYHKAESIYIGPRNDYSKGKSDYDNLIAFYEYCRQKNPEMNLNWAAWGIFNGERIKKRDWRWPDHYYFARPNSPDEKPAGWYVTAYTRGDYSCTGDGYERLLRYIFANGLDIIGNAYEDYVLNELVEPDPQNYLIRISIQVTERIPIEGSPYLLP
ncbi:MAG: MerR family transcriptional regulator [Coriobacteriales bacterium]|jgi:DNA-binding transcriptional MerR regulator|nr:MerR family transcriptional regulator [Coriobacteriales bacterium]